MNQLWKGAGALLIFAALIAICGPACVQNESSFFIREAKAHSCDEVTPDSAFIGVGTMDVRYSCGYTAVLMLGNQLVRRGDDTKLQTETSRIVMTSFDVLVQAAGGGSLGAPSGVGSFTVPATGFIDPSNGTEPGYGLSEVLLVDGATAQFMAGAGTSFIEVVVVGHGRTLGGQDLETAPWVFPITVCDGCLCRKPADDSCTNPESAPKEPCLIQQDSEFDCRFIGVECTAPGVCGVF